MKLGWKTGGMDKRGVVALNARDEFVELNQFSPGDVIVPVNHEPVGVNQPTFIETINNALPARRDSSKFGEEKHCRIY